MNSDYLCILGILLNIFTFVKSERNLELELDRLKYEHRTDKLKIPGLKDMPEDERQYFCNEAMSTFLVNSKLVRTDVQMKTIVMISVSETNHELKTIPKVACLYCRVSYGQDMATEFYLAKRTTGSSDDSYYKFNNYFDMIAVIGEINIKPFVRPTRSKNQPTYKPFTSSSEDHESSEEPFIPPPRIRYRPTQELAIPTSRDYEMNIEFIDPPMKKRWFPFCKLCYP